MFDLRVSPDGQRWGEWEIDHVSGELVHFAQAGRYVQYRVRMFGNLAPLAVRDIAVKPTGSVDLMALDVPPVAPTFKVHATRMGMVGGRTANGHRITKRDHYVSLPSWRSLSSRGGSEYMVRVTYNGRSSVAPVYDVGPWNVHDDYWNKERERFSDLPWGYPQDHAAYFDKYNKGYAEKGRVRFPTAIDIGDGVWWDDLKIKGDRAVVEVTFLWLGTDPLEAEATPTPVPTEAPTAAPTEVPTTAPVETPPTFAPTEAPIESTPTAAPTEAPTTAPVEATPTPVPTEAPIEATPTPVPTEAPIEATPTPVLTEATPVPTAAPTEAPTTAPVEATPTAAPTKEPAPKASEVVVQVDSKSFQKVRAKVWYDSPASCGPDTLHWTYTTTNPDEGENTARWQPKLAAEAAYEVRVYIPKCEVKAARTSSARYLIKHRDGVEEVAVDQAAHGGEWVSLGRYTFAKGQDAYVELSDVTGDSMKALWYASVKWTPAADRK
ncbi:hypothetical protein F8S13_15630 [Chloroflexia bacterium SDU3-3]|nr:hypothetical protein F8S13_15630 [Chloroflexia bacterium SDU3-3]